MLTEKMLVKNMQIDAKKNREIYDIFERVSLLRFYPRSFDDSSPQEKKHNDALREGLGCFLKNRDKQENGELKLFGNSFEWDMANYNTILKEGWGWNEEGCKLNMPMFRLYMHVTEPEAYFQRVSKHLVSHDFDETYRLVRNEMHSDLYNPTIKKFLESFNPEPFARLVHSLSGCQLDFLIGYLGLSTAWSGKDGVQRIAECMGAEEVEKLCNHIKIKDIFWQNYYLTHADSISELLDCGSKVARRIARRLCKRLGMAV